MTKRNTDFNLTKLDDLFTTQEQRDDAKLERVQNIPLGELHPFKDHPFKVQNDEDMKRMIESIKKVGAITPAVARPISGGYEIISGHRRLAAYQELGLETMPVIVRDMTDDEAVIAMVDANLQREHILPSEKAFAYKMKLDAMKRQAGRPSKDNCATPLHNFDGKRSREILAEQTGESHEQIRKFIRLTELIPELLDMVDENKIALRPAVELSYLAEKEQRLLYEEIGYSDCTPSHAQAIKMRKFAEQGQLNAEVISSIMQEEKPNQKEQFRMPREKISKYFPAGTPAEKIEDTIIKALELYRRRQRDMER